MKSERALVTQMLNAMDKGYTHAKYSDAITAAREYLATEPKDVRQVDTIDMAGERADLIDRQRWVQEHGANPAMRALAKASADMLEADAQQAKRVPMTDAEAHQTLLDMASNIEKFGDGTESNEQLSSECIRFILERVDNHGITPANKPTDWSAA